MSGITCANGPEVGPKAVEQSPLYRDWLTRVERNGGRVQKVTVHYASVDQKTQLITQLFMQATVLDPKGHLKQDSFLLRSDTVDVTVTLRDEKNQLYCVFVEQYRPAVGADVISNIAGGIEPGESAADAARREVGEEVNGQLAWGALQRLNRWCIGIDQPFHVSPGGTNEGVYYFAIEARATTAQIQALHGTTAGLAEEGERITVHVVPAAEALAYLSSHDRADGKAIQGLELAVAAGLLLSRPS